MNIIPFYLFYFFVRFLAIFPLGALYYLSDILFPILYYVFPYRKKLVFRNLSSSFPDKNNAEIKKTAKAFYRHFCDSFIESMIAGFLSEKELKKRFFVKNPEVCEEFYKKDKSISLLMAHYGNWEWSSILPHYIPHKVLPIYKPLRNKHFDKYIKKNREKFGCETVPMEKILRRLLYYKNIGEPTITEFIGDQRPRWAMIQHWITFLNQDTPVILGAEKISRKLDHAVVFLDIQKVKRGYYEVKFIPLYENSKHTEIFEITERYYEILEKTIRKTPELWLWTHNRWKHEKEKYISKRKPTV